MSQKDFLDLYNGKKDGIVLFHHQLCTFCHKMMPAYHRAAEDSDIDFFSIEMGDAKYAMEMMKEKGHKIIGVPLIFRFSDGEITQYEGDRSTKSLIDFAKE